ncbi:F0F1 ATP synthase subunit B [Parasedimentitalea psychrophila]|uniref:ATP synthase subunit b n=1 Tax=Parasedimentitalea psychrophila TaxID=2997337 RepID=A0A9Y2P844_9RHOB|nr:F0F1 ATP synthase subunit B [Parasedimentitalea psychrophila]WIY26505.1 F0F1 ATP synthase subunit B [Parasedimentitalea psychrophila]
MRNVIALALTFGAASPALAASGPFLSMSNTNFVVLLGFLLFVGILLYAKVPSMLGGQLDSRAAGIQSDLDDARALREEAQTLLASYERKHKEVQEQADRIVAAARVDASAAADQAKADLESSIARRLASAEDQIISARDAAVKDVRDQAISIAIAAADLVIAKQMTATEANKLIDAAISDVETKLH